ncbi:MAG TPA: phosphate starvation-inducible protein PhoH [Verrucomicrobiales bacterium]|nr:phosphate starvation-inducible protein PhoH [Verrucomicrobiales bacterium]
MAEQTLEFENAHFLLSLFAGDIGLTKEIESNFGVKVTTRDAWIRFTGDEEAVSKACEVMKDLESARRDGAEIKLKSFQFAVNSEKSDEQCSVSDLLGYRILGGKGRLEVVPRTRTQLMYLKSMDRNDVVFGVGPAGTGKTYLAVASAMNAFREKKVGRLVLTRPAVEAGEALGFLPGDLTEKILPYLRPLYDALYDMIEPDEVNRMIERGQIEIAPLAYMRGRTINNAAIILDEAQNTTSEQMLMFLTRLGEGSRCVVTGDPSQTDLKRGVRSGLNEANEVLSSDIEGVDFVEFERCDVVRHRVVSSIIGAYAEARES